MDRVQTFFSMDGAKIFCSHMAKTRDGIFFSKKTQPPPPPGSLMVAPLFIDEENSKLPPKYSNCVKFGHFTILDDVFYSIF